eukprot:FR740791.1.p2 GENE.FR740791.1~~FR740791.1.p2  ORF type:complete len:134 (-),score=4.37 FR740791.1:401-748(-)
MNEASNVGTRLSLSALVFFVVQSRIYHRISQPNSRALAAGFAGNHNIPGLSWLVRCVQPLSKSITIHSVLAVGAFVTPVRFGGRSFGDRRRWIANPTIRIKSMMLRGTKQQLTAW